MSTRRPERRAGCARHTTRAASGPTPAPRPAGLLRLRGPSWSMPATSRATWPTFWTLRSSGWPTWVPPNPTARFLSVVGGRGCAEDGGAPSTLAVSDPVSLIGQRRRNDSERWIAPLAHIAVESFPAPDLVLLCSFGGDLDLTQTDQELRVALRSAGYGGSLGRASDPDQPDAAAASRQPFTLHRFTDQGAAR